MKKAIVILALALVCAMAFAACGGNAPGGNAADGPSDAAAGMDYLSWTGKEWNAASDAGKTAAAKVLLEEAAKATGQAGGQVTDGDAAGMIQPISAYFQTDQSMTLQDVVDAMGAPADQAPAAQAG